MKYVAHAFGDGRFELVLLVAGGTVIFKREVFSGSHGQFLHAIFRCKLAGVDVEIV